MAQLVSRATPMASELASTQAVNSLPSTYQSLCTGLSQVTLAMVLVSMPFRVASCTSSFHPDDTEVACHFIAATATLSQPHTWNWPTSFQHTEKLLQQVMTGGTSRASLSLLQQSFSSLPCSPSTFAPFWRGSGSLHINSKCSKCFLTTWEDAMHSLTKMSSMYDDVAFWMFLSYDLTTFMIAVMMLGTRLRPNPSHVRQYLVPLISMV